MSDINALLEELRRIPADSPRDSQELAVLLNRIKSIAGRWADVLYEVRESAYRVTEPGAAVALEMAFRRAEQSYVELEIAHSDLNRVLSN
ncbi:hypothetical protein [Wenjunlia tyrosinilytica]|jgi:hypothetical protein|uniref:Uncharacterized protein n=1 Tax=Wenjunlia tyrosinilytica TaxID=1544741 RepID=A0A917ZRT6_9ACTN|nr:hypothetical protein [Wenjunlia tyrosinilytica]GGO89077.1 hypothetical protein GCM10012280_31380 [Wenjunlia tyrosinilytica]